jgi:hypothetical protein
VLLYVLPTLLLVVLYFSVSLEISNYWNQLQIKLEANKSILGKEYGKTLDTREFELFRRIWLSIYAMLYFAVLGFINIKRVRNYYLGWANIILSVWVLFFSCNSNLL